MDDPRWSLFSPFAAKRCAFLDIHAPDHSGMTDITPAATSSMRSLEDRISLSWLLHEPPINQQPPPPSPFAVGPPLDPTPPADRWDIFPATPVQPSPLHATRQRSTSLPDVLAFDRIGASPWSLVNLNVPRPVTLPGSPTAASKQSHDTYNAMHQVLGTHTPCDPAMPNLSPLPHLAPAPHAGTAALDELLAKLVALRLQGTQGSMLQLHGQHPGSAPFEVHHQIAGDGASPSHASVNSQPPPPVKAPPGRREHATSLPLDGLPKYAKTVLYKTEPCRGWEAAGSCRYGVRCQFAHGVHELRPVPCQKHKTVVRGCLCPGFIQMQTYT